MKIREIVERLECIEQLTDGESRELVLNLIDELIEFDMKVVKFFEHISMEEELMQYLINEGLDEGLIGRA